MKFSGYLSIGTRLQLRRLSRVPLLRTLRFLPLRRTSPVSRNFGYDRGGQRVGRYYVEEFLSRHRGDIRGRTLEIADNHYTVRFGGSRVTKSDVLHATIGNPDATIVSDLTTGEGIPDDCFECIIFTQTLQSIFDIHGAVRTLHRILVPGGVILATCSGISQISRFDAERWGDYWRFTKQSARRLFEEHFDREAIQVESQGNILTAFAVLHGLTLEELTPSEISYNDEDYQVIITIRARKLC